MQDLQEAWYGADVDYEAGSPHLSHHALRRRLVGILRRTLWQLDAAGLPLKVLEIGAGHGGYTEPALAAGAQVTAVEMSRPALLELNARYGTNDRFAALLDADGSLQSAGDDYSLILAVSVLHHIPDYVETARRASALLVRGGAFLSFQDPIWYPRLSGAVHGLDRGAYYAWRLRRGRYKEGFETLTRRVRGRLDPEKPGDMVEYHVVRQGVDDVALQQFLQERFRRVEEIRYWSHQMAFAQRLGDRLAIANTFGLLATDFDSQ